jgi:hypothetical protein
MSDPVREVLGAEGIQRVLAAPLAQARCPVCTKHVPPAGPVNVVISISGMHRRITFCHTGCAPSALMGDDFDLSDLLPDESAMNMAALLLSHGTTLLPVLVGDRPLHGWHSPGAGGELTDMLVSALLARGMALVPRLRDAPRTMLAWPATLAYAADGLSHLLIEPSPGDLFYEGTVGIPPEWRHAAERLGWCVLYSGSALSDPISEDINMSTLRAAAAAGTLVGARLRLIWTAAP